MGRCSYENLNGLMPALDEIRKLEGIKEPKPGIFYYKSQGFLHFHEKDQKIWADIRDGVDWGTPVDIPSKVTAQFLKSFYQEVLKRYKTQLKGKT